MKTIAFDTETHLIKPGCPAPKLVCLSVAEEDGAGKRGTGYLLGREDGLRWIKGKLADPGVRLVGHRVVHDLGVVCAEDPGLIKMVFDAIDRGSITDTLLRAKILDNAAGNLKYQWDEALGEFKKQRYSLEHVVWRYLKRERAKGEDTWRMRYRELDGVPINDHPEAARLYAEYDAEDTMAMYLYQRGLEPNIIGENWQIEAAWALHLQSMWGLRTDPKRVAQAKAHFTEEWEKYVRTAQEWGFVRSDKKLSKDTKAISEAVRDWFKNNSEESCPETPTGKVSLKREVLVGTDHPGLLAVAEMGKWRKLLTTYVPVLEQGTSVPINCSYNPILETYRTSCSKPNCFSGDTEILTTRGWIRFDELGDDTEVAQWKDGVVTFVKHNGVYKGRNEIIDIRTEQQISLKVTPNHRCLLRRRRSGEWFEARGDEYPEDCQQITAARFVGGGDRHPWWWVTLICATQADGHYHGGGITWGFTKERKIKRLRKALKASGLSFSESGRDEKRRVRFRLKAEAATALARLLGKDKAFGPWLLQWDRETLDLASEEVFFWDGCWSRKSMFASANKRNADWVQILVAMSGRRARLREYTNDGGSLSYQIDASNRAYSMTTNRIIRTLGEQDVYCVSVPSSYIVVRTGQNVAITGNCQNLPQGGGIRECFVPRSGNVFLFCDYSTLEMRTLAQVCLWLFGHSAMAESLREGRDLHLDMAAQIAGVSYKEAQERLRSGDPEIKKLRKYAKIANFGFPGGMGPKRFIIYAKGYGVDLTHDQAQLLRNTFMERWPEMAQYFEYCSGLVEGDTAPFVEFLGSGMLRGDVTYTAVCNGFFQHLAAMGAKQSTYRISRACYTDKTSPLYDSRPIAFLHDEIGMEVPDDGRLDSVAKEVQRIMNETMAEWVPDIPIESEAAAMRRWLKGAEPVFHNGLLVPGKPEKVDGNTIWVPDLN